MPDPVVSRVAEADPDGQALLADPVGPALLVVLDTQAPAERLAFVVHDMFDLPSDHIAVIVGAPRTQPGCSPAGPRRRVRGAAPVHDADLPRQRQLVGAFLAASRDGDFRALAAVLDPEVVLLADSGALRPGGRQSCAARRRWPGRCWPSRGWPLSPSWHS